MLKRDYRTQVMRKTALIVTTFLLFADIVYTQSISASSMYLGQEKPELIPERLILAVTTGPFAAERIAISDDGKEIYYSEVKNYYPATGGTIKYYRFSGRRSG